MSADWKDLFRRWGGVQKEAEIRISGYLVRPDCLTCDRIQWNDESAARIIGDCERIAEELRGYRQALAARYAELSAMAYSLRLDLIRDRGWKGPVTYWLRLVRVYADGHEEREWSKDWPGNERHKALKAYREELKARPGIETRCDTEKAAWEH